MHYIKAKTILSKNNGVNLYRGCTHGCIYCDSRSKCYHLNHEFTNIAVKENAIEILDKELAKKKKSIMVTTGSMSDPYMHIEKELCLTQKLLELVKKYSHGIHLLSKSTLMLRDIELLKEINNKTKAVVSFTLTTINDELSKIIEPNAPTTRKRLEAMRKLSSEGINVGVWLGPFLPFINDDEENFLSLLNECKKARVKYILCFGIGLTLRDGNREYFYNALDKYFPSLKEKYIKYHKDNYVVASKNNNYLMKLFVEFCSCNDIIYNHDECFSYMTSFEK